MELTQNDRDIVDPESAKIRKIREDGLEVEEELKNGVAPTSESDAKELATHEILGGWRKGLLVARNVIDDYGSKPWEDEGISRRTWYRKQNDTICGNATDSAKKLSIAAFSRLSNLDRETISRYLKIWNLAVADGLPIPHPSELVPGQEIDFSAREKDELIFTPDSWKKYTKKPSGKEKDDFLALAKKIKAFLETDLAPLNATNFDEQKELEYSVDKVKEFGESLVTFGNEVIKRCNDSAKDLHHEFVE